MPRSTTIKYDFEKFEIKGKVYQMPKDVQPGSRRWKFWQQWQDRGLKLPTFRPDLDIHPHGVTPYVPFAVYEKHLKAAAA